MPSRPRGISRFLADQVDRLREAGLRLLVEAAPQHQAAIKQVMRDLDALPSTVAESYLLQALGTPASQLRAIERAIRPAAPAATMRGQDTAA
jgi:hypothetical protein